MRTFVVTLLLVGFSGVAYAQKPPRSVFVEGSILGDRDSTYSRPHPTLEPGGGGTIGRDLGSRFSIRFDVERAAAHVYTETYESVYPKPYRSSTVSSQRATTYAVMFGWHVLPRDTRVDVSLLAGLGAAVEESRYGSALDDLANDGSVLRHAEYQADCFCVVRSVFSLGADAAVPVTTHLSIVPELRFHVYNVWGTVTRPKIAIRWTF